MPENSNWPAITAIYHMEFSERISVPRGKNQLGVFRALPGLPVLIAEEFPMSREYKANE